MIVTDLSDQACDKSYKISKDVTSCQQVVPNLLTSCVKRCEHNLLTVVCKLATSCKIFTCVLYGLRQFGGDKSCWASAW